MLVILELSVNRIKPVLIFVFISYYIINMQLGTMHFEVFSAVKVNLSRTCVLKPVGLLYKLLSLSISGKFHN